MKSKVEPVFAQSIERAANRALEHQSASGDISIVLTDDARLHQLNLEYSRCGLHQLMYYPFPRLRPTRKRAHVIWAISSSQFPRAEEQAKSAGHPLEAEVQLLVVHGVLHLLGHDHANEKEKTTMWKVQAEILESIGLSGIEIEES